MPSHRVATGGTKEPLFKLLLCPSVCYLMGLSVRAAEREPWLARVYKGRGSVDASFLQTTTPDCTSRYATPPSLVVVASFGSLTVVHCWLLAPRCFSCLRRRRSVVRRSAWSAGMHCV
ncbi:hypothetical protein K466DRAFT_218754 [Polyporus arcularius HHB13444]|uniref:Uncharacterized protein n=1 Tax=Polyporus arcularius HHB13444 TaxID=1314778 RepID=A0A5C3P8T4_9APHY|nr:hypothetical protein K466DRAFT_218754 [Polyporus arcularius HHB13444]